MARNQHSWGLKYFLVSIVLFFCLAVITVEGRSIPLIAQLTPEYTGTVNSNNRNFVGQAFTYLSGSRTSSFHVSILVVCNVPTDTITKVVLYNTETKKAIGTKFTQLKDGFLVYDTTLSFDVGEKMNTQKLAVNLYTKAVGNSRPAISGLLANNGTTFIADLTAEQEVTAPSGVTKNDGFASAVVWSTDAVNYFISLVVNHDVDQKVTAIHLHGPAASNTNGVILVTFSDLLKQAGKVINIPINGTVMYWLSNHLCYINIHTTTNTGGALRGQLIPTTTPRIRTPTFPNGATQNGITILGDGSLISGDVGVSLKTGGARNLTENLNDERVATFGYTSNGTFDNDFRFELPVTIRNRFSIRSASIFVSAAADIADNNKYQIGLIDLNKLQLDSFITIPGAGKRKFSNFQLNLDTETFITYLGPGGLFVNLKASALTGSGLFVDRFYIVYYINNAYAANVLKSIFYKGSDAEE